MAGDVGATEPPLQWVQEVEEGGEEEEEAGE